ncbi:MAG TPA: response regulator [Polyangiaceae bacterium]|nr:response regulator [Polyangiaceae bacterium]
MLESPPGMVIFALDTEYRYLAFNQNHARTMQQIWGVQIGVGLNMLELIGREDDRAKARANFDRALAGASFTLIEEYGDTRMDRRVYEDIYSPVLDDMGAIVGLAVYLKDITEQRLAELELERYRGQLEELVKQRTLELTVAHRQLSHAQKLESLGVLAGGIAHDFNNLLAVILARAELCFRDLPEHSDAHCHAAIIRDTALEARMLTKQLLGYAGKGKFVVSPLSVEHLVRDLAALLRASVSKEIRLEFELGVEGSAVRGDETQLRQVLLNLVTNAAEAIGPAVGSIVIRTGVSEVPHLASPGASLIGEPPSGRYVYLEVEDSGSGISAADREKIFDPFFTTKFTGRGLGLAAVLGIVKGHHGSISFDSTPGQGTRFRVLLPALDREDSVPESSPRPSLTPTRGEDGCVLVVDDEPAVRAATSSVLSSIGYRVLEADGGVAALEQVRADDPKIDLVLLDLAMPNMNGQQTLAELKKIRPDLPVVLLTAYAEDEARLSAMRAQLAGFVAKPFAYDELLAAVRAASSAPQAPGGPGEQHRATFTANRGKAS